MKKTYLFISVLFYAVTASAEDLQQETDGGIVTYLGNEALLLTYNNTKVLFDPFFHNGFNTYQLVPPEIQNALFKGAAPYDNINAIFISHAHGDHFAADDLHRYLTLYPETKLIAPQQAVDELLALDDANDLAQQIISIKLAYQDAPVSKRLPGVSFDAVRIPHAGWPQRADVSNLVYRVTLEKQITVMHMGDADPNDEHFKPLADHWQQKTTDAAYPPYWFFTSLEGPAILKQRIQAKQNVGIHVPIKVPEDLIESGATFFSKPGETQALEP